MSKRSKYIVELAKQNRLDEKVDGVKSVSEFELDYKRLEESSENVSGAKKWIVRKVQKTMSMKEKGDGRIVKLRNK